MGNVISSFFSGFAKVIGDIFSSPLDFLAGKSCNSVCGSTWDFICYIENFCVAHLLKTAMVLVLLYIVLLFLYLLHKLGICECVCWSLCRMLWACFASCLTVCDYCCTFLCFKLHNLGRRRNRRQRHHRRRKLDIEVLDTSSIDSEDDCDNGEISFASRDYAMYRENSDSTSLSRRKRDYRGDQLRKSLRPRSHRIGVGISRDHLGHGNRRSSGIQRGDHNNHNHDHNSRAHHAIRVTRTSKFVRKGTSYKGGVQWRTSRPAEDLNDQATKQPNDQHQHRQRVPLTRRQLRSDSLLDMASIEQERAFSTLETIESESESDSESNGGTAESSYNYDQEDYEFFEANMLGADLGLLDQYEDEDDMDEDEDGDDEDELDVDELTYEELIALGEFIGVEKRGLSLNEISSCLHPIVWKTTSSVNPHHVDRCVVCQVEYEDGEKLVGLPNCEHPYHSECISKWLQLKKSCPICSTEVISSSPSNNNIAQ